MSFLKRRYYIYIFTIKFLLCTKKEEVIINYNHKYKWIHISRAQVTKKKSIEIIVKSWWEHQILEFDEMTKHTMRRWPITKFDSSKYRVYRFLGRSFSRNLRKRNPIAVGYKGHHGTRLHLLHVILWLSPLLFFPGQEERFIAKLQNHTDDTCICTGGDVGVTRKRNGSFAV